MFERVSDSRCPNACNLRGTCLGNKCACVPGWKGPSCAEFTCEGVNNCSGRGTCVAANACQCSAGWWVRKGKNI